MSPQEANYELVRGHGELIDLAEAEGRVALEGGVPYPPGVPCIQPGEKWSKTAIAYFMALAEVFNLFRVSLRNCRGYIWSGQLMGSSMCMPRY